MSPPSGKSGLLTHAGVLIAVLACLVGGGCSPSFEADVHELEITWHALRFQGGGNHAAAAPVSVTQSFVLDATAAGWSKDLNANVRAANVRLHAASGVASLDFIHAAHVAMVGSNGATTSVMSFDRTATSANGPDISVNNADPIDITRAWASPRVRVDVAVTGSLPARPWAIDVALLLSGQLSYEL
jgi:hypothetical protein